MGLHSKTRYVIQPQGADRKEQVRDIIRCAVDLFERVQPVFCPGSLLMTRRFARYLSLTVTFTGFTDEEVFRIVTREVVRRHRMWR